MRTWRIVKVATTKAQRKLFFNLRSKKKGFNWLSQDEASAVADSLGVEVRDVHEMESRLTGHDMAFDPLGADDEDATFAPAQYLEDCSYDPALRYEAEHTAETENASLYEALSQLDERSRDIVQQRWLSDNKATLHELAAQYGVSAERIRQIEQAAMKKLKGSILA